MNDDPLRRFDMVRQLGLARRQLHVCRHGRPDWRTAERMEHTNVNRSATVARLLGREAEEARRVAFDLSDADARATNTFGSAHHRKSRERAESEYGRSKAQFERLSDSELAALLDQVHP